MGFLVGDIVFGRAGKPAVVAGRDPQSGRLILDERTEVVQETGRHGVKNGLTPEAKEEFHAVLESAADPDAKKEIDRLFEHIQEMKEAGANPRLLRYLDAELQYRISRERYMPREVGVDPNTIGR